MTHPSSHDGAKRGSRVAAVADLHCARGAEGKFAPWLGRINELADVLLLGGDLTDYGLPEEAEVLAKELSVVHVPVVAVLGNHDFESGKQAEVREILQSSGVRVLDGESTAVGDIGIVGVKGFAGGFGRYTLGHWGEPTTKRFVQDAVDEALLLETGLARLRTRWRIVLLHYSPIEETVRGEPEAIHAFLGCSRLEEPLLRYPAEAVFHGHAHRGSPQGRTRSGLPVYNVALPLLRSSLSLDPPVRVIELNAAAAEQQVPEASSSEETPRGTMDASPKQ